MKLEDQVCRRDQSEKLVDLGVTAKGVFCYDLSCDDPYDKMVAWTMPDDYPEKQIPAFTVAELVQILHKYSNWEFVDLRPDMASYLSDILIKEIEGGHIDVKEIFL